MDKAMNHNGNSKMNSPVCEIHSDLSKLIWKRNQPTTLLLRNDPHRFIMIHNIKKTFLLSLHNDRHNLTRQALVQKDDYHRKLLYS